MEWVHIDNSNRYDKAYSACSAYSQNILIKMVFTKVDPHQCGSTLYAASFLANHRNLCVLVDQVHDQGDCDAQH
jgi:hypothetical protein